MTKYTPLPDDYTPGAAAREIRNRAVISLHEQIEAMICHDSNESAIEVVLDWASQIRTIENLPWSYCIDAAMVFYFG